MSTSTESKRELITIPTSAIHVVDGHNPRGEIDTKGEAFEELKASIKEHGILQPILVGRAGDDGKHPIIAGHRRYAAAVDVKLAEIPAMVADLNGGGFSAAIAENLIREDMTPLQEARALLRLREGLNLKQKDAAKAMGKSERWARNRQHLLDVPESIQQAVDAGELPLEAVAHLLPIAKVSPKAAELIVSTVKKGSGRGIGFTLHDLTDKNRVAFALEYVAKDAGLQQVHGSGAWQGSGVSALPVTGAQRKEIKAAYDALPKGARGYYGKPAFKFVASDAKKAAERGVLIELSVKRYGRTEKLQYIADGDLVTELALKKIPAMKRKIDKDNREREELRSQNRGESKARREEAKKTAEEEEARAEAINEDLAKRLAAMPPPKPTDLDLVRLVCAMALGESYYFERNVAEGLGRIAPEYNGADGVPGAAVLLEQLAEAKTASECLRLWLQMSVAAKFTQGSGYTQLSGPPGVHTMLEDLAEAAGVLPDALLEEITAEREARREEEEAQAKLQAEEEAREGKEAELGRDGLKTGILDALREKPGIEAAEIATKLGVKEASVYKVLGNLTKAGSVKKKGLSYELVEKAADADQGQAVYRLIENLPGVPAADIAKKMKQLKPNRVYRLLGDLDKAGRIKKNGKGYEVAEDGKGK